jgi:hypothetical protein
VNIPRVVYNKRSVWRPYPWIGHGAETLAATRTERDRRRIVNLVFIIYWLLIFEGVLRKWIFPDAFKILFFIRDPFVLIVYALAVFNYRPLHARHWLAGWLVLGLTALLVGLAHLWAGTIDLMVLGYGWRNYFYYIPMAFVIGANFRQADLYRLIRQTLLVAIPIALLVSLQIVSPSEALINAGAVEGGLINPGMARGFVRTYGTFTSSSGQTLFVGSLMAMILANWMLPNKQRPVKGFLLPIVSVAVAMNLALSGSRGAYILSVVIMLFAILSISLLPRKTNRLRGVVLFIIIGVTTMVVVSFLYRDVLEATFERAEGAFYYESELYGPLGTMGRIIFDFGNFARALSLAPHFGYGVGWFGNAFSSQMVFALYAEDDWSRNIFELGPALGLLFMSFRIALVVWLTKSALEVVKRVGNPVPLLLSGFIGVILLQGQITGHGSVNGYGWLFAGFCIAANKLYQMPLQFTIARD